MKSFQIFLLSILFGLLLSFAWPEIGNQFYLGFIAFIPLFYATVLAKENSLSNGKFFLLVLPGFLVWNLITTWWVSKASFEGALMAFSLNSIFMTIVYTLFYGFFKKRNHPLAFTAIIPIWLGWEKLHLIWELTWPWLTLGNVFSNNPAFVQWYEYTGHLGGSVWLLSINILAFKILNEFSFSIKKLIPLLLTIFVPLVFSLKLFYSHPNTTDQVHMVVVQPNIDPYNEKFSGLSSVQQLHKILALANTKITNQTTYVIAPETAIPKNLEEEEIQSAEEYAIIDSFLRIHPTINFLCGISSVRVFATKTEAPASARKYYIRPNEEVWVDFYNTGAQFNLNKPVQFYHKSKLVPGSEIIPYSFLFKPFEKYALDLGGTTGTLGTQKERSVFISGDQKWNAASVICYESVYGDYVGDFIKNGAHFIAIITNDGWWGDTPGYKQHLSYARLRAIECRRSIARSANTGISCFIDEKGNVSHNTKWWETDVISENVTLNNNLTLYVRFGDWVVWVCLAYFLFILIKGR